MDWDEDSRASRGGVAVKIRAQLERARFSVWAVAMLGIEKLETGIVFNPTTRSFRADPHRAYRELRERDPFHRSRLGDGWILSRYDDVVTVLGHKSFSADERNWSRFPSIRKQADREGIPDPYETGRVSMLRSDAPDHTRLRNLVSKAFTPRAVETMRVRVEEVIDELLAPHALAGGRLEGIAEFAAPLPIVVIAEMLGIPVADRERFRHWSDEAVTTLGDATWEERRQSLVAMEEMADLV